MQGPALAALPSAAPACSIGRGLDDWHALVCGPPEAPAGPPAAASGALRSAPIAAPVGAGTLDLVRVDDDFILLGMRGRFHRDLTYLVEGEGWTRLHFRKAARTLMVFDGVGPRELQGPLCQILHQPQGMRDQEWIEGGAPLDWITLFLRPRLLAERFRLDSLQIADPLRRLAAGADDFLLHNWSLSPAMLLAMDQLLGSAFPGDLRRLHLEAKAVELVCLLAGELTRGSSAGDALRLGARDIDALHEARRIIAQDPGLRHGLEGLARRVGINRNKLTAGFRQLFGQSVAGFALETRLGAAWQLLQETDLPVSVIAARVGYGQAAAFCTAFRQRFGVTPLRVRDRRPGRAAGRRTAAPGVPRPQ